MHIRDLTAEQRNRIVQALQEDGFNNVQEHNDTYITYSKGPRDFELYTINMQGGYENDDFVNIHFREQEYFNSLKNVQASIEYADAKNNQPLEKPISKKMDFEAHLKSRHTSSLNQKSENETEDTISSIPGWELVKEYNLQVSSDQGIYSQSESSRLLHLSIKRRDHFALNHAPNGYFFVYEGTPDLVLAILQEKPEEVVLTPNLVKTLSDIKLEINDL